MSLPKELLDAVKQDKKMLAEKIGALKARLTEILSQSKFTAINTESVAETIQSNDQSEVVAAVKELGKDIQSLSDNPDSETAFSAFIEQGKIAKLDLEISEKAQSLRKLVATSGGILNKQQLNALNTQIKILEKNSTTSIEDKEAAVNLSAELETAADEIVTAVEAQKPPTKEEAAFQSIIEQGKVAEENLKIQETVKELQTNLDKTRKSLTEEQITSTENLISTLKSDKLASLEAKKEARIMAEEGNDALERIAENQYDLIKEFKSGFSEFRGKGIGGLIRMIVIGIPALLAGITVGIIGEIKKLTGFLGGFNNIFGKTAKVLNRMIRQAAILFSRKGFIGKFFIGIGKSFSALSKGTGFFAKIIGSIGKLIQPLSAFAKSTFAAGKLIAKLAGPIGIVIAIITGLIGGIKGAIKGFKEDGIIGMFREGLIGIVDGLVGGLVKMIGSLLGGIFKLLGFDKIGETIKSGFSDFVDGVFGALRGTFNMIIGLFTLDFGLLKEGIGQMLDSIINIVMGIIKGIGGLIAGSFMLMLKALKAIIIDLPIKIIQFAGTLLKAIFFDLPVLAFKLIFKALKFLLLDLPSKLVGFAGTLLKAMFFDLPLMALQMVFDGIKYLFMDLPSMLIGKVTEFFTNMVSSIGDAFSGAFDFVKRLGKASFAALKAALPGGESPKEAFLRVMGGESGGEEKEEKENKEKIEKSVAAEESSVSSPQEPIMPKNPFRSMDERVKEFQERMKNAIAEKDTAEDAKILEGSEQFKAESAERIADRPEVGPTTAQPIIDRTEVLPAKAPIGVEKPAAKGLTGFLMQKAKNAILGPNIGEKMKNVLSSTNPLEEGKRLFERSQNKVENFKDLSPIQMLRRFMDAKGSSSGAELTSSQIENNQLTREAAGTSSAPVIAPSSVNNAKSTVSNTTIAAPPHIDKTQSLFGMTNLGW
jgi:hypothetical protein